MTPTSPPHECPPDSASEEPPEAQLPYSAGLLPHHAQLVAASAIAPDVAAERGYRSVDRIEAAAIGFTGPQARAGLLVPRHTIWGPDGAQLRPDQPRLYRDGKSIKYETPRGQGNRLDVLPRMLEHVRAPREAVFITEGARKADALASLGIPAISLSGVWSWRGRNERGGLTALPDWSDINIVGSIFVLAFDVDILTKYTVHAALSALRRYLLARKAAAVRVLVLPEGPWKGIDDWIAAHKVAGGAA